MRPCARASVSMTPACVRAQWSFHCSSDQSGMTSLIATSASRSSAISPGVSRVCSGAPSAAASARAATSAGVGAPGFDGLIRCVCCVGSLAPSERDQAVCASQDLGGGELRVVPLEVRVGCVHVSSVWPLLWVLPAGSVPDERTMNQSPLIRSLSETPRKSWPRARRLLPL
jgi:hypothetical protein